jgi:hypothetical protein
MPEGVMMKRLTSHAWTAFSSHLQALQVAQLTQTTWEAFHACIHSTTLFLAAHVPYMLRLVVLGGRHQQCINSLLT